MNEIDPITADEHHVRIHQPDITSRLSPSAVSPPPRMLLLVEFALNADVLAVQPPQRFPDPVFRGRTWILPGHVTQHTNQGMPPPSHPPASSSPMITPIERISQQHRRSMIFWTMLNHSNGDTERGADDLSLWPRSQLPPSSSRSERHAKHAKIFDNDYMEL